MRGEGVREGVREGCEKVRCGKNEIKQQDALNVVARTRGWVKPVKAASVPLHVGFHMDRNVTFSLFPCWLNSLVSIVPPQSRHRSSLPPSFPPSLPHTPPLLTPLRCMTWLSPCPACLRRSGTSVCEETRRRR